MSKLSLIFQIIKKSFFKPGLMLELAEEKSEVKDDENFREHNYNDLGLINLAGNNNYSPRPLWRIETRYECRGKKLNHKVWDLCYGLK